MPPLMPTTADVVLINAGVFFVTLPPTSLNNPFALTSKEPSAVSGLYTNLSRVTEELGPIAKEVPSKRSI